MARKLVIPKSLGAVADLYYKLRNDRLAEEKKVAKMREDEGTIREYLINNLSAKSTGVAGKVARVQIVKSKEPQVKDWAKFQAHIKKTGQFDLLARKLNGRAVKDRWEANKTIPGVGTYECKKVSLTKL